MLFFNSEHMHVCSTYAIYVTLIIIIIIIIIIIYKTDYYSNYIILMDITQLETVSSGLYQAYISGSQKIFNSIYLFVQEIE